MWVTLKKELESNSLMFKRMIEMLSQEKIKNQEKIEKYQALLKLNESYIEICRKRGRF